MQNQVNGVNMGKEVKTIPLFADKIILYLENSEVLTKKYNFLELIKKKHMKMSLCRTFEKLRGFLLH